MNNKRVSIIVPIYNAEEYLSECIESILNLEYANFELLLINDGSKDNSEEICKCFVERDERIILISKENGGVSSARNLGIEKSTGDWIAFVDSDDWVKPDFLNSISEVNDNVDIIHQICMNEYLSGKVVVNYLLNVGLINAQQIFVRGNFRSESVTYFFLADIIKNNDIRFSIELKYSEDREFIAKCLLVSNLVLQNNRASYFYRANPNSAIRQKKDYNRCLDDIRVCYNINKFVEDNNLIFQTQASRFFYSFMIDSFLSNIAINRPEFYKSNVTKDLQQFITEFSNIEFDGYNLKEYKIAMYLPCLYVLYRLTRMKLSYIYRHLILKQQ